MRSILDWITVTAWFTVSLITTNSIEMVLACSCYWWLFSSLKAARTRSKKIFAALNLLPDYRSISSKSLAFYRRITNSVRGTCTCTISFSYFSRLPQQCCTWKRGKLPVESLRSSFMRSPRIRTRLFFPWMCTPIEGRGVSIALTSTVLDGG